MAETLRLLRVFLASPGDLAEERIAARDAVKEVNELVARPVGYQIDLIGWEDTISEARRPQAVINDDLDQCDLFIGMLYARWGTPPDKEGRYTSGFEEEYCRSRQRLADSGKPDIKLFFKTVDDARLKDIGPELKKVLDFKKTLIEEKAILFQPFDSPQDFARLVRAAVSAHIHRLAREKAVATREDLAQSPRTESKESPPSESLIAEEGSPDAEFLLRFSAKLHQVSSEITAAEVARLRLLGASVNRSGNAEPDLGVHDANLLYSEYPHDIFSSREVSGLLDCGLGGLRQENTPIWQWLARAEQQDENALTFSTLFGADLKRAGAIEVMRLLHRQIETQAPLDRDWILGRWFSTSTTSTVKNPALAYLGAQGTLADVEVVEMEIAAANSQTVRGAIEAALAILLRYDQAGAVRLILNSSFETLDESLLAQGLSNLRELDADELRPGLDHRSPSVRAAVLTQLGGQLDHETLMRAASDDSIAVRSAALAILDKSNTMPVADIASILIKPKSTSSYLFFRAPSVDEGATQALMEVKKRRFKRASLAMLEVVAESDGPDRDIAWLVLAERKYSTFVDQLRLNVDDRFKAFYEKRWSEEGQNPLLKASGSGLLGFLPAPDAVRRRNLIRSALDILLKRGDDDDLQRLRGLVDEEAMPFSEVDVLYLRDKGNWEDIKRLALIGHKSGTGVLSRDGGPLEAVAAAGILKLAAGRERELLLVDLPGNILGQVIAAMPDTIISSWPDAVLEPLLQHANDPVRRVTALKVVKALARKRSQSLLNRYLALEEQRYYNVIFWLDLARAFPVKLARTIAARALG